MDISNHPFVLDLLGGAVEVKRIRMEALRHADHDVEGILDALDGQREANMACLRGEVVTNHFAIERHS